MIRWDRGNYAETSKQKEVNPRDLRFTQRTIANRFKAPYEGARLTQVVDEIKKGVQNPSVLYQSPLKVYEDENGIMWCENNRRLWVLRKAGVLSVLVKLKSNGYKVRCLGTDRESMKNPEFYPELRGEETSNSGDGMNIGDESLSHADPPQYASSADQRSVPGHFATDFKRQMKWISLSFNTVGMCFVAAAMVACFVALFFPAP